MRTTVVFVLAVIIVTSVHCVNRDLFKVCQQSSFCRRSRTLRPGTSVFQVLPNDITREDINSMSVDLINTENNHLFSLTLATFKDNTFRLEIDEKTPLHSRYRVVDALKAPPVGEFMYVNDSENAQITVTSGLNKAVITRVPFRIDFYNEDVLTVSANARGLMRFEHLRLRVPIDDTENAAKYNITTRSIEDDDPESWEEIFQVYTDSKPNGPEAIALDFTFPQADILFGIPEHANSFVLEETDGGEPYRLYNLDVFEYELNNPMALYGSVPVIYGHGAQKTAGMFWQNAAETWVDIYGQTAPSLTANFMSESGIIDAFILLGPGPNDAFKQYSDLTGVAPLPQLFALGYHQCRWNYFDQLDVEEVSNNFDVHDIPMDTMWLDIEYTDEKKYFTWDLEQFPNSLGMIQTLTDKGRHLVVIIDPHIKIDQDYSFHNDCSNLGYYTKTKDGNDFEGECWPGLSGYPDVFNPDVRQYWANHYKLANFPGTTLDVMIWNDMNEPSVFSGPELTMLKDNIHYGGWEHRNLHNLFGHLFVRSTYEGLAARNQYQQRPFVLSRSHFAGTQRYATIWTGDNLSEWDHLQASIKMCLSAAVAGFSFCGADVGGFFGNPDGELFSRWYQAAIFQPFFRGHAHIDTERREPWLYPEDVKLIIRDAIRRRYSYLPFWYTLFYEHERFGLPIMRPLLSLYPHDRSTFTMDDQYLLADILMIRPVMQPSINSVNVYFPLPRSDAVEADLWYDVDDFSIIDNAGFENVPVDSYKIPAYQRGGTILAKKEVIRSAATLMVNDPYTLIICVDRSQEAKGTLYIDDETSFEYRDGKYLYLGFEFDGRTLHMNSIDPNAGYVTQSLLQNIYVAGLNFTATSATLMLSNTETITLDVTVSDNVAIVEDIAISLLEPWTITINGAAGIKSHVFGVCILFLIMMLY